jgi:hypothetical protein
MAVFGEIVAGPVLTGLAAVIVSLNAADPVKNPAVDPCKPPMIRLESANLAALPGPNSPACKTLRATEAGNAKKEEKPK